MINNLQLLRAFAAISVVLFHIIDTASTYSLDTRGLKLLAGWGAYGVDLFFVISGFVMFHSQLQQRVTPGVFFKKRLIRIVPIYWSLTVLVAVAYLLLPALFRELQVTTSWTLSSLAFLSWWWNGSQPLLYVGWTLEWEMAFYLLFALSLAAKSLRVQMSVLVAGLALLALYSGYLIVIEFLFGIIAAYIYHYHKPTAATGWLLVIVGIALLLVTLQSQYRMLVMELGVQRVLHWGVPALLIVLGVSLIQQFKWGWLHYLGHASYSIYLIQMLTIPVFYKLAVVFLPTTNTDVLALACLLGSIMIGCLTYALIEKPLTTTLQARAG